MAKTGTTSIAKLFSNYRAYHELDQHKFTALLCQTGSLGALADNRIDRYIRRRDFFYGPEVDSSQLNGPVASHFYNIYPDAHFILTVREPLSWLESFLEHSLRWNPPSYWQRWRDLRFASSEYHLNDMPLRTRELYPLAAYLKYWAWHNDRVLDALPSRKVTVIATHRLGESVRILASLAGVASDTLRVGLIESNRKTNRQGVMDELDANYVRDEVTKWCGGTMARLGLRL
jgi:hypothetical protein